MTPRIALAALCALTFAPAAAEAQAEPSGALCDAMGVLATSVMQNRQYGVPREEMLALAPEQGEETPVFLALIDEAYSVPLAGTMVGRQRTIAQFGAAIEASCIETIRSMT
jgi:hypothetical protein